MIILYSNNDLQLDQLSDNEYRITIFKNNHWAGSFTFTKEGIQYDELTDGTIEDWIRNNFFNGTSGIESDFESVDEIVSSLNNVI